MSLTDLEQSLSQEHMLWLPEILTAEQQIHRFVQIRTDDITGNSGLGLVQWGVEFPDGRVATRWAKSTWGRQTAIWDDVRDVIRTHGHNGATQLVYLDNTVTRE